MSYSSTKLQFQLQHRTNTQKQMKAFDTTTATRDSSQLLYARVPVVAVTMRALRSAPSAITEHWKLLGKQFVCPLLCSP